jgi:hypothetical protein
MTSIIKGENEKIDLETAEQIWDMSVVQLWADILALLMRRQGPLRIL